MSTQTLDQPVVASSALRSANFFNGRLLTGEDLRREQETNEARLRRLGRTAGEGVAHGLEVSETTGTSTRAQPVVTVTAGLALCRSGQTVELGEDIDLALARPQATEGSEPGGLFADCQPFASGTYTAGAGVYLLTIAPARQGEGRAPVSGLGNGPAPCNVAVSVDAARFRLIRLALTPADLADAEHLRNRVAHRFFATGELPGFARDPAGAPGAATLLDTLRAQTVGDDEVPLALVGWSFADGIGFVDAWAVRRRVARGAATATWPLVSGERPEVDGEARLLQFQDHIADLALREPSVTALEARSRFDELPAAGLVPVSGGGFSVSAFFAGMKIRGPVFMEGAKLGPLLRQSFAFPSLDVTSPEVVWLYFVRENAQAATATNVTQVVAFANGHVPYAGDARFDLSYWNFANVAHGAT